MPKRDPYRALARLLEGSLTHSSSQSPRVNLHLTREEWALIIDALDRAAKPYAPLYRPKKKTEASQ